MNRIRLRARRRPLSLLLLVLALVEVPVLAGESALQPGIDDPTLPPQLASVSKEQALPKEPPVSYRLGGVFIDRNERHAVINGQLLSIGERLGGATLEVIDADGVVLRTSTSRVRLRLIPEVVIRP